MVNAPNGKRKRGIGIEKNPIVLSLSMMLMNMAPKNLFLPKLSIETSLGKRTL